MPYPCRSAPIPPPPPAPSWAPVLVSEGVGRCRGPTETARPLETARFGLERPPEYGRGPRPPEYGSRSGGARCQVYRSGGRRGGESCVVASESCVAGGAAGGVGVMAVARPHRSGRGEWLKPQGAVGGGAGATGGALVKGGAAASAVGAAAAACDAPYWAVGDAPYWAVGDAAAATAAAVAARVRARPLRTEAEAEAEAEAGGHPHASDGIDEARGPRSRTRVSEHHARPLAGGAAEGGEGRAFTCCTCANVGR